jgi:hypothetical protein
LNLILDRLGLVFFGLDLLSSAASCVALLDAFDEAICIA